MISINAGTNKEKIKVLNKRETDSGYRRILIGFFILIFSLVFPRFIWFHQFDILDNLYSSIAQQDSGLLIITSAKLVLLNTIRHLPIYAGAFIMAEGFYNRFKIKQLAFIISLIVIPIIYKLISIIYNISFVFAGPSYLTVLMIFLIHKSTEKIKPILIKIVIVSLFLFALDWLDIVPMLSKYGFGRGEIAISIIQVTEFIEASHTMNFLGLTFSIIILVNAFILSNVAIGYYNRLFLIEEAREKEERLKKVELEAVKSRYLKEVKHLVHDLKTPLVTIQGLSGVINLLVEDKKVGQYTEKICNAVEKMSLMISEILYDDKMYDISIAELFNFIKVQLSMEEYYERVNFKINDQDIKIHVNKFRMSRAIINLVDNALKATNLKNEKVIVKIFKGADNVKIYVKDKGVGISEENLQHIWKAGYTTDVDNNTGLGLNFVKRVIDDHNGSINISSQEGIGTEVKITLPGVNYKNG